MAISLYICYRYNIYVEYMVQAMIRISKQANQILNIVKARHSLKDKSEAIEKVVLEYGEDILEPELRPDFVERMKERQNESAVEIKDLKEHFGL